MRRCETISFKQCPPPPPLRYVSGGPLSLANLRSRIWSASADRPFSTGEAYGKRHYSYAQRTGSAANLQPGGTRSRSCIRLRHGAARSCNREDRRRYDSRADQTVPEEYIRHPSSRRYLPRPGGECHCHRSRGNRLRRNERGVDQMVSRESTCAARRKITGSNPRHEDIDRRYCRGVSFSASSALHFAPAASTRGSGRRLPLPPRASAQETAYSSCRFRRSI